MRHVRKRTAAVVATLGLMLAGLGGLVAPGASAAPQQTTHRGSGLSGTTAVTTAPGIAGTLVKSGVIPLPVPPASVRLGYDHGINLTYGFPITGGNPDLDHGTGHILHAGGVNFLGLRGGKLEIGKFDIDLAAGKVFAREVNFEANRIPVFDLDLSKLQVTTRHGTTVLSGIGLDLDPVAADALNTTFGLGLPDDGSLLFGTARVTPCAADRRAANRVTPEVTRLAPGLQPPWDCSPITGPTPARSSRRRTTRTPTRPVPRLDPRRKLDEYGDALTTYQGAVVPPQAPSSPSSPARRGAGRRHQGDVPRRADRHRRPPGVGRHRQRRRRPGSPTATRRRSTESNTTSSVRRTTTCGTTMDRWVRR